MIQEIIQRLNETLENIPQYLDRAPSELPHILHRFGLDDISPAQETITNTSEKTHPVNSPGMDAICGPQHDAATTADSANQ